jgi:hypothetical protein
MILKTDLLRLQSLELIYEKRVFPELEYIFKNVITQEVAYNSLLFNRRKALHGAIGDGDGRDLFESAGRSFMRLSRTIFQRVIIMRVQSNT